jgi:outer membrane receptor protein involved in Fe transport
VARGWDTSLWLALSRISGTLATGYLPKAPILGGALWTTYTLQDGPLAGVGAGLGITGRTGIQCYGDTPFRMPGMMRFDTSLFWHQKQWRVDLFARNLFNARAYENALSGNFIPILPGRTFALRVTRSF